jgi:hypothetical protein
VSQRLVTLTGAGGIGKTRLGFEVARHQLPRFTDGVWAAEPAPLSNPGLVPVTVATAHGLELTSGSASPRSVANALRSRQLMLVLDNCEHVIDAAARMAEALLRANPAARAIATSREPRLYDVSGSTAASSTSRRTRIIRDAADDISQPGEWIDAVQFRGRDERINRGRAITSTIRTSEESGLPPNRDPTQSSFGCVVGQTDPSVFVEATEYWPAP